MAADHAGVRPRGMSTEPKRQGHATAPCCRVPTWCHGRPLVAATCHEIATDSGGPLEQVVPRPCAFPSLTSEDCGHMGGPLGCHNFHRTCPPARPPYLLVVKSPMAGHDRDGRFCRARSGFRRSSALLQARVLVVVWSRARGQLCQSRSHVGGVPPLFAESGKRRSLVGYRPRLARVVERRPRGQVERPDGGHRASPQAPRRRFHNTPQGATATVPPAPTQRCFKQTQDAASFGPMQSQREHGSKAPQGQRQRCHEMPQGTTSTSTTALNKAPQCTTSAATTTPRSTASNAAIAPQVAAGYRQHPRNGSTKSR
jgi:hypothetical protein